MKKRIFAVLLMAVMVLSLLPATAFAAGTDKTIMLSTSAIKDPTPVENAPGQTHYTPNSYIYFGTNGGSPIKWRVLDADKANDGSTPAAFLFSEYLVSKIIFEDAGQWDDGDGQVNPNEWQHSDAQEWCRNFASSSSNFSAAEQSAMLGVAKQDVAANNVFGDAWGESSLTTDDKMFLLSTQELADYVGNYHDAPGMQVPWYDGTSKWWLRSPSAVEPNEASYFTGYMVSRIFVPNKAGARPAFNLDLNSVLFTSAAVNGKPDGGLQPVSDYTGNEWKLTLRDSSRDSFTIVNVQRTGDDVTVYYNGAKAGSNEYISAMIVDGAGACTHYGRLTQAGTSAGMATFTLPELPEGSKVYIFSEQYNGDCKTDYAGGFVELSIPADGSQDGREVELRSTDTHIQWKYTDEGDEAWRDLASLADLSGSDGQNGQDGADGQDGREVELQAADGYIQWRYTGGTWNNLIALSLLKGADGTDGEDGQDGITPQLRINADTNMWEVSYDNGGTWTSLGVKATGSDGQDGADGLTPYIGSNGNWWIGTTDTGIKAAGANGTDGQDGADGLTPYIGSNGNWWIGNTDTGIKAAGANGTNGTDGKDGSDGLTPYIGSNGNWWIGTTDTGIKAAGTNGTDGKNGVNGSNGADGVGIADLVINENGELVVTLTDGTVKNLGKVKGADGADGVGIAGVAINENGELIVTLTDGTELNAGAVSALTASDSGLKTLVYVSLGTAGVSLAGLIVVLTLLLKKRGSLIPQ